MNGSQDFCCPEDQPVATIARMGKRKAAAGSTDDAKKPPTDVIRVEADLAYKLGVIASIEQTNVSEIVSPHLRQFVEKRYAEALRKAAEQSAK